MPTLRWIRILLAVVIAGLVISGVTAFPLEWEVGVVSSFLHSSPAVDLLPALVEWIDRVHVALQATGEQYPFLAYGTDWLAFAHLAIAVAFIGPLRDPVRNVWVIRWGMIMCAGIVPLALIAGTIRGIPWGWMLIDISFGVVAIVPLLIAERLTRRLAATTEKPRGDSG
ncbi:hypothetical protein [Pseudolysinimonas sp.]|uniref:hypothetical protein n=1 Tax=Pseudolysinimonas sp. TaxID=2680009 RepID=UPI0037840A98